MLHVDLNLTPDIETQLLQLIKNQFQGSFEAFIQAGLQHLFPKEQTPLPKSKEIIAQHEEELFGIWADRDDIPSVNDYVRQLRKNRDF